MRGNKLEIISIIDSPILGGDGNKKEKLALIKGIFKRFYEKIYKTENYFRFS